MASNTYQQSSRYRAEAAKIDPENQLLWRFPLHRLEGEVIRDSALVDFCHMLINANEFVYLN
jgi:hypothetical protein